MFQYAFGKSLSIQLNCSLYFDPSFFKPLVIESDITPRKYELNVFTAKVNFASAKTISDFLHPQIIQRIFNKAGVLKKTIYKEDTLCINDQVFKEKPSAYFDGFWQSEHYFSNIENKIREDFVFKSQLNKASQQLSAEILKHENAVSVHIRRGDYISSERTNQIHGLCSSTYYINAVNLLKSKLTNPHFYFFSDDPEWVKQELLLNFDNFTLVDHNKYIDSWQDMALMSKCKHHVIANSSFSWWGAWLNPDKGKIVIAPKNWFNAKTYFFNAKDLLPANWLKLENE